MDKKKYPFLNEVPSQLLQEVFVRLKKAFDHFFRKHAKYPKLKMYKEYTSMTFLQFGFVLLMALGVDYSIFLMDRFNEYKGMPVGEAILTAMRNMGTVIFSAVIILGGTFAAMYPAGVLSLAQIATIVLAGLVLYAFVFLPFFVPVMVKAFGRANWFPFDRNQEVHKNNKQDISG